MILVAVAFTAGSLALRAPQKNILWIYNVQNHLLLLLSLPLLQILVIILSLFVGWGASILWCAWARRKPSWRNSSRDDWPECDWMHWRVSDSNFWWLELSISHTLWPKAQCFSITWARFYHCWATQKKKGRNSTSAFLGPVDGSKIPCYLYGH